MNTLFWRNHLGDTGTLPVEGPSDVAANVNHNATGSRLAARGAGIMKSGSSGMAPPGMPHLEDIDLKYRVAGARSGHAGSAIPDHETGLVMANEGNNTNSMWSLLVDPSATAPAPMRRMVRIISKDGPL